MSVDASNWTTVTPSPAWCSTIVWTRPHSNVRVTGGHGGSEPLFEQLPGEGPLVAAGEADPHRVRVGLRVVAQQDGDGAVSLGGVRDEVGACVLLDCGHHWTPRRAMLFGCFLT
ncbi:hypothetical protein SALBM135S_08683 [Streptomyces alboniger]